MTSFISFELFLSYEVSPAGFMTCPNSLLQTSYEVLDAVFVRMKKGHEKDLVYNAGINLITSNMYHSSSDHYRKKI